MGCPPMPEHTIFWVILAGEIALQHFIIINSRAGELLFNTAELTTNEQIICWAIGSLSLLVNLIVKKIDIKLIENIIIDKQT
jgi:hypothetical protein